MVRKDRACSRTCGGVAINCRNDWKVKVLNVTDRLVFESVWCKIATTNSEYYAARIYHPSHPVYDSFDLLEYMSDTCDQVLGDGPNVKIIHNFQLNIKEFTSGERIL